MPQESDSDIVCVCVCVIIRNQKVGSVEAAVEKAWITFALGLTSSVGHNTRGLGIPPYRVTI